MINDFTLLGYLVACFLVVLVMMARARFEPVRIIAYNISWTYNNPRIPVFANVSFHIPPGAFVQVLGRNSSGKTTLLKAIATGQTTTGWIHFWPPRWLMRISGGRWNLMAQDFPQQWHTRFHGTVLYCIAFGNERTVTRTYVERWLKKNDFPTRGLSLDYVLDDQAPRYIQARVALMRTLIQPCNLRLFDETPAYIDTETLNWLVQFIKNERATRQHPTTICTGYGTTIWNDLITEPNIVLG